MKLHTILLLICCISLLAIPAQAQTPTDSLLAVPQYHITQTNESITQIAEKYKISTQQITDWNKLRANQPLPTQLIIGYIYYHTQNRFTNAQQLSLDSVKQKINKLIDIGFEEKLLLFNAGLKKDSLNRSLILSGYVDAYYGYYTDSVGNNNFQKFPTIAPRSNTFGLNIVQLSARYSSEKARGIFTLHYGDIPASAWSPTYNLLQEANVGIKLRKDLWFDIGFFRTHLGCESIQPRENINVGVALTTYYDPYFLSGAKLSYKLTDKLLVQASIFNGYNTFVQINKRKTYGATLIYEANDRFMCSYNALFSNETPDSVAKKQTRLYQDFFLIYKHPKIDVAFEANFGLQTNSHLNDSIKTAYMFSTSLISKYKFNQRAGIFGRCEIFQDNNDMLTGPIFNTTHQLVGLDATGLSIGGEWKPTDKSYLRMEYRYIQTLNGAKIFRYHQADRIQRMEWLMSTGFWF